jgi:hypothetical protein
LPQIRTQLDELHDDAVHPLHVEGYGRPQPLPAKDLELGETREKVEPVLLRVQHISGIHGDNGTRTRLKCP